MTARGTIGEKIIHFLPLPATTRMQHAHIICKILVTHFPFYSNDDNPLIKKCLQSFLLVSCADEMSPEYLGCDALPSSVVVRRTGRNLYVNITKSFNLISACSLPYKTLNIPSRLLFHFRGKEKF